ncbi:sugar-transfer associated ATP-grasp domain-containing protein [Aquimarina sp. 2201CG5-10]|uniref:sugar-transfer associated ATP-grasp domain-containing protein n=1 Tax=Aquimarina callyspongiae TaxID=3098150 RepID=UPI002AB4A41E|nr:sugar-transfer associated ATP-grasp domain-containing protein [Aquimarina sp. 2201CG5-10]MDY8137195.1 sugar-transfer associated ATP-grasp domain-containing protein [Aquimarina sp. 2201CG5-10]
MLSKIFNIKSQNKDKVIGLNERNIHLIYPNNAKKHYPLADDKVLTKEILHKHDIPCAKTYAVIESNSQIKKAWNVCKQYDKMAIKPANGCGGGGIKILKKDDQGNWISSGKIVSEHQIFQHMAAIVMGFFSLGSGDRVLIEECIEPHLFFHEIYPQGVPDFRIITLNQTPLMGMLRMPTDRSDGKANLHQNGIGIGVDMINGVLTEVYDGNKYFDCHPDSKYVVKGVPIPYWKEILAISVATAKAFPLNYLGIDIVIDQYKGPQIMEINVRPGLGIQLVNKKGLKEVINSRIGNK